MKISDQEICSNLLNLLQLDALGEEYHLQASKVVQKFCHGQKAKTGGFGRTGLKAGVNLGDVAEALAGIIGKVEDVALRRQLETVLAELQKIQGQDYGTPKLPDQYSQRDKSWIGTRRMFSRLRPPSMGARKLDNDFPIGQIQEADGGYLLNVVLNGDKTMMKFKTMRAALAFKFNHACGDLKR